MSYGVEAGISKEKLYALVKPQPQATQQAAEQTAAVPKDQKASGVSWTRNSKDEAVASTSEITDTAVLSMSNVDVSAAKVDPTADIKAGVDGLRRSLVDNLYENYEKAVRQEYAHDAMQARLGASLRNDIMSKIFLRLSPALLASLGEQPAEKLAGIRERVVSQLKQENYGKMQACLDSELRLRVYGQA